MAHNFFLSHFNGDKDVAELIANMLKRITLQQISPWFSSDASEVGGLKPGNIWFTEILNKITNSNAVVIIVTPNSIDRPWVYFESGIAQALPKCEVIPICVGINRELVPAPLNLYQCYQTTDYKSLKEFTSKLLTMFSIAFDEEMAKPFLKKTIEELAKVKFNSQAIIAKPASTENLIDNLKNHIDKRFIELISSSGLSNGSPNTNNKNTTPSNKDIPLFSITLSFNLEKVKRKDVWLDIWESDTFQTVTDNIYFQLAGQVPAFTYLERWVLIEEKTNQHLIIREIAKRISAKSVFNPNFTYVVTELTEPYKATESRERVRK